jgi:hypothetical protein
MKAESRVAVLDHLKDACHTACGTAAYRKGPDTEGSGSACRYDERPMDNDSCIMPHGQQESRLSDKRVVLLVHHIPAN